MKFAKSWRDLKKQDVNLNRLYEIRVKHKPTLWRKVKGSIKYLLSKLNV